MKKLSVLFLVGASLTSFGADRLGSKCGLTDDFDDSWVQTKQINLSQAPQSKVKKLSRLTKQQFIITAKYFAKEKNKTSGSIHNTQQAVEWLANDSEAADVDVTYYNVNDASVTQVIHYPGGNPYGVIFQTGSKTIVAYNQDGAIVCR